MNAAAVLLTLGALLLLASPGPAARLGAFGQAALLAAPIDSTEAEGCESEGPYVWRFDVTTPTRRDTLARIIRPWPLTLGDSALVGLVARRSDCQRRFVRYSAHTGRLVYYPLPSDTWHYFTDVAISPGGAFVLYLARTSAGERTVVRRFPTGALVTAGPWGEGCDCDLDSHHAHWVTRDSFELGTHIGPGGLYRRVSGSAGYRRVHSDTVTTDEAYWHPTSAPR